MCVSVSLFHFGCAEKEVLIFVSEMIPKLKVRQSAGYRGGAEGGGGGAGKAKNKGKKKK